MNPSVKNIELQGKIFGVTNDNFVSVAFEVFRFQYEFNPVYRRYCDTLKIDIAQISLPQQIPFLPISLFKTHQVVTTNFDEAVIFESSGTTHTTNSKHYVKDLELYQKSFTSTFHLFYGDPAEWCILALLPSYLERNNSSLVMMADQLIQQSKQPQSGFYLADHYSLHHKLKLLEKHGQKTLFIGVTFALLDFAEQFPMPLYYTTIMETGGMKGRREEMTRQQVHEILCNSFQLKQIHSEYGMTELLSQGYSTGDGLFKTPPWMSVLLREEDDPFAIHLNPGLDTVTGIINVIDLANIYSCSFIATDDAGKLYPDGSFEVLGRVDNSDIRGCSLLTL